MGKKSTKNKKNTRMALGLLIAGGLAFGVNEFIKSRALETVKLLNWDGANGQWEWSGMRGFFNTRSSGTFGSHDLPHDLYVGPRNGDGFVHFDLVDKNGLVIKNLLKV